MVPNRTRATILMPQSHPTTGPVGILSPVWFLARKAEWRARRNFTSVLFSWSHQATGPVRLDTAVHLWLGRMIRRTPLLPRAMPVRASYGPRKGIFNVFHGVRAGPYDFCSKQPVRGPGVWCDWGINWNQCLSSLVSLGFYEFTHWVRTKFCTHHFHFFFLINFSKVSLNFVPWGQIYSKSALVQVKSGMAWHPAGHKPLPEAKMTHFTNAILHH